MIDGLCRLGQIRSPTQFYSDIFLQSRINKHINIKKKKTGNIKLVSRPGLTVEKHCVAVLQVAVNVLCPGSGQVALLQVNKQVWGSDAACTCCSKFSQYLKGPKNPK